MYISAILSGALLLLSFLFVPETMFDREAAMNVVRPNSHHDDSPIGEKAEISRVETVSSRVYEPYTFARSLKCGMYRPGLLKRCITPYTTLLFPGTWMVMLHYAGLVGLIVTVSTVAPQLLAQPPYLWGNSVGLINVGGLIGTVLGALYTYATADFWVKRQAKRESHGFSEPEARIPLMFPALIIAFAGSLCFGFSAQAGTPMSWIGLEFGMGMISFGLMQVPSIGFNYLIESYGGWSADCCKFNPNALTNRILILTQHSPHGRLLPRHPVLCLDFLRRHLGRRSWSCTPIRHLRSAHGCFRPHGRAYLAVWQEDENCYQQACHARVRQKRVIGFCVEIVCFDGFYEMVSSHSVLFDIHDVYVTIRFVSSNLGNDVGVFVRTRSTGTQRGAPRCDVLDIASQTHRDL